MGDNLANSAPDSPEANSPFVILTHCSGVMLYWGGEIIAGREVHRDRLAEFRASGSVTELLKRVEPAKRQLRADVATIPLDSGTLNQPRRLLGPERTTFTASTALVHILEEMAQHYGQMEITRDLLRSEGGVA